MMGYRDIQDGKYEMMFIVECQKDELYYYDKDDSFYNCRFDEWSNVDFNEWIEDHFDPAIVSHYANIQCVNTLKKECERLTYNKETQMLETKIEKTKIEFMKDRLRTLNSRLIDMQQQIDEVTELSYQIQEELLDLQDKQMFQKYGV